MTTDAPQGQDQDTQASSDGAAGDRGADLPDVSTEASSDCGAGPLPAVP